MNVHPSQPNPSVTNDSTTENNIGKRQSEGEQEVDNELRPSIPGRQSKKRERNSPTSESRTQHTEFNCNNRYEQLSHLPGDDNVDDNNDIILTDRTNNTQTNGETSKLQDPKPPPIFIYGVTNYKDMVAHLSATIQKEQYQCKVISKDTIKIHVATPDSYRKLNNYKKIKPHTTQIK
jgi:hypothetical protein